MNATTLQAYALEKGVNFNWNTASNAEKADLAMQMFMERTKQYSGNFAKEAADTFEGSLGAMTASWKNVLGALSLGQDVTPALQGLATSISNFVFKNLIPMVVNVVKALPGAIITFLTTAVPMFITEGSKMIQGLAIGFVAGAPVLMNNISSFLSEAISWISNKLPAFIDSGVNSIVGFANGLIKSLPTVLGNIGVILSKLLEAIIKAAPSLLGGGLKLILGLAKGISDNYPAIVKSITGILTKLINTIIAKAPEMVMKGFELIKNFAIGLLNNLPSVIGNVGKVMSTLITFISNNGPKLLQAGFNLIVKLAGGLIKAIPQVVAKIPSIISSIVKAIIRLIPQMVSAGFNLLMGLAKGIGNAVSSVIRSAVNAVKGVIGSVKSILGIRSPSRVFRDEIGAMIGQGWALGIEDEVNTVSRAIDEMQKATERDIDSSIGYNVGMNTKLSSASLNEAPSSTIEKFKDNGKPAQLVLKLGNREFKAFVEDITAIQDKSIDLQLSY